MSERELYERWRRGEITYREYATRTGRLTGDGWWSRFWRYWMLGGAALHGWEYRGGQVKWRIDDVLRSVELPYGIEGFAYAVTDGERRLMFDRDEWDYAVATRDAWNAVEAARALAAGVRGDTEGGGEK